MKKYICAKVTMQINILASNSLDWGLWLLVEEERDMIWDNNKLISVRTGFDLDPKRERIQIHIAQTMNLQSAGKKASLILGQDIEF